MKPFPKRAFFLVICCQFLVLGGMIAQQEYLLKTGDTVLLQCEPIDPRSLFSGDYVILNYTISRFSDEQFQQLNPYHEEFTQNATVYVALQKHEQDAFWEAAAVSHDRKKLQTTYPTVIRGTLQSGWQHRIRYGVEHYFVPQFEGLRIERELADASVEIAVSGSGASAIKRLFLENTEVKFY